MKISPTSFLFSIFGVRMSTELEWLRIGAIASSCKYYYECFITVTVYTIRGTNIPHVSLHYMFRPDGAIFTYIGVLQSPVSLSAALPTLASVYILGAGCMCGLFMLFLVVKCIVYGIYATNCVDGNCNKAFSYTQYDAEVHF
jgi:hypothetical protein